MATSISWSWKSRPGLGCRYFCRKLIPFLPAKGMCVSAAAIAERTPTKQLAPVIIPKRKERNSLSILKALAASVKRDPNAPDYRYIDDPYLIPTNMFEKKKCAYAISSGQKAALFAINGWPHLFASDPSVPQIKAYQPRTRPYLHSDVSEESLQERIAMERTKDAIDMYEKLKAEGKAISMGSQSRLLDLLCIYNSDDPPEPQMCDEHWFRENFLSEAQRQIKTWKEGSYAEKLFAEISEKDADVYTSMILGLTKHFNVEKAWLLYEELLAKDMPVRVEVFNAILEVAQYLKDTNEAKHELALVILKTMEQRKVKPNLGTFNALFLTLSNMSRYRSVKRIAMEALNEMKACRIEPSLGTWHNLLRIFYPKLSKYAVTKGVSTQDGQVLNDVLGHLAGKQFEYRHEADMNFFAGAMVISAMQKDLDAAYKVDALLNTGRNAFFIGDALRHNNYYTMFFKLIAEVEPLDKVMMFYRKLVPNVWVPNVAAIENLIDTIELYEGYQYIPELWTNLVSLDYTQNPSVSHRLMYLMAAKKNDALVQQDLITLADKINDFVNERADSKRPMRLTLSGELYGYFIKTCLNGSNFDKAWQWFSHFRRQVSSLTDAPSEDSLTALVSACIAKGDISRTLDCLRLMTEMGCPTKQLKESLQSGLQMDEKQRQELSSYV